jgi:hypothetical protein
VPKERAKSFKATEMSTEHQIGTELKKEIEGEHKLSHPEKVHDASEPIIATKKGLLNELTGAEIKLNPTETTHDASQPSIATKKGLLNELTEGHQYPFLLKPVDEQHDARYDPLSNLLLLFCGSSSRFVLIQLARHRLRPRRAS